VTPYQEELLNHPTVLGSQGSGIERLGKSAEKAQVSVKEMNASELLMK
jgi:hypothetical protein